MTKQIQIGTTKLTLTQGNITEQDTDAIVNAANSTLLGGGGVDGAIHAAGGPQILAECQKIVAELGPCPTGEAVMTTGGQLQARFVIHTVGPVWSGGQSNEPLLLINAYRNTFELAASKSIRTLSFPSISTGAHQYPIDSAAEIALRAAIVFASTGAFDEIRFVLFSADDLQTYLHALDRINRA